MKQVFIGYDEREEVGLHVFMASLLKTKNNSEPCAVTILGGELNQKERMMRGDGRGSNAFTYERFLIPYYMGFRGWALFVDGSDMLLREDVTKVWDEVDPWYGVQVVKHGYRTKARTKYVGTEMESDNRDYERKNWSSVVMWNCGHYKHRVLTPEWVRGMAKRDAGYLHRFGWLGDEEIGDLDGGWNYLVGEDNVAPRVGGVKLVHWTHGVPGIEAYKGTEYAWQWKEMLTRVNRAPKEIKKEIDESRND